jgi:hypothetical protein
MEKTTIEVLDLPQCVRRIHNALGTIGQEVNGVSDSAPSDGETARWDKIFARLQYLRSLNDDWDGQGAVAPAVAVLDRAEALAESLRQQGAVAPSWVVAGPDGEIVFDWQVPGVYLEAEVSGPGLVEWMLVIGEKPSQHWESR